MSPSQHSNKALSKAKGSAIDKYRELILGDRSLRYLIHYELVMLLCAWVPGALGLFLRKHLYPGLLGSCGRGVVFGANVTLRHPRKIHLGDNVVIDDNVMLDAKGESNRGIQIGNDGFVGRNTILSCKNGDIILDHGVNIGFNCEIFSGCHVHLEEAVIIGAYCYLVGGEGYDMARTGKPLAHQALGHEGTSLVLKKGCWLGTHIVVLNQVTVGEGSVIGAGAVVTRDTADFSISGGIPAKQLGMREAPETSAEE